MKNKFIVSTFLTALITLLVFQSCDKDEEATVVRTALDYAVECEKDLGKFPNFRCEDAIEVPVTQNGVPVTFSDPENPVIDCDFPAAFQGQCEPGGRLGRREGINPDGTANPNIIWMYICRAEGMAVIGYNTLTGATGYFLIPAGVTMEDIQPSTDEPAEFNKVWMPPLDVATAVKCQDCHMADPFLHSPFVDQVRDPADTTKPLVPIIAGPNTPYYIVGEEFPQPYTKDFPGNACTSCHRAQCTDHFQLFPLDEMQMPGPFYNLDYDHSNVSDADRQAIRDWCETLNLNAM